jgi:hypothetical protein
MDNDPTMQTTPIIRREPTGKFTMKTKLNKFGLAAAVSFFALPAFAAEEVKIGLPSWTDRHLPHRRSGRICTGQQRDHLSGDGSGKWRH